MKLTDNNISESVLNELIDWAGCSNEALVRALLELKHRRAEDRQREHDSDKKENV